MRYQNLQAVVLRKRPLSENDFFITFYSPVLGKFDAVAKGARRLSSSFSGHLETLNICNIQIYKNANRYTLTQCQTYQTFKPLRNDLQLSMLAFLILEIFYRSTLSEDHGDEVFNLLITTLNKLSKNNNKNDLLVETFKTKLLNYAGALPDISCCSECHKKWIENDKVHINSHNHIVCINCINNTPIIETLPFNIMKLINHIAKSPVETIEKIKLNGIEPHTLKKFNEIFLQSYINFDLNYEKVSASILE